MSNLQEKKLKTRISHKHNFEIAWNEAHEHDFVPLAAEWIIYDREVDKRGNLLTELPEGRTKPYAYERFKIGNGVDKVGDLDFITITPSDLSEDVVFVFDCGTSTTVI